MKLTALEAMKLAIQEGYKGSGFVAPNPRVGCVILDRHMQLLATGYHAKFGEAHAEVDALNKISDPQLLNGAHVFVTLEPCAHEGKTGSCAKKLAALPLGSVTFGLIDPFPEVAGKGQEILKQAGIRTEIFRELQFEFEKLAEVFLHNVIHKKSFVTLKIASSLDGHIALPSGESQWITNEESRAHVQTMRGHHDAILVGVNTFIRDNPRLNSRDPHFANKVLKVVILDPQGRSLRVLPKSEALSLRKPEDIILVTSSPVQRAPCDVLVAPLNEDGQLNIDFILRELWKRKIASVYIEGGAFVASSFLKQSEIQRVSIYYAPKILGRGLSWTSHFSLEGLANAIRMQHPEVQRFGDDLLVTGRLQDSSRPS